MHTHQNDHTTVVTVERLNTFGEWEATDPDIHWTEEDAVPFVGKAGIGTYRVKRVVSHILTSYYTPGELAAK